MNNLKLTILTIFILVLTSCNNEMSQEGIKLNEDMIKQVNSVINIYMTNNGYYPDNIETLIPEYFTMPKNTEYIINFADNEIVVTNLLYDIISIYNIDTQKFEHTQE